MYKKINQYRVLFPKHILELIVKDAYSYREVILKLNLKEHARQYRRIKELITEYNININHFYNTTWNKGRLLKSKEEIGLMFSKGYKTRNITLKKYMIEYFKIKNKCNKCNITSWEGKPIGLELDHINGDNTDNRIENLRLLCLNCHSQTETYKFKKSNVVTRASKISSKKVKTSF